MWSRIHFSELARIGILRVGHEFTVWGVARQDFSGTLYNNEWADELNKFVCLPLGRWQASEAGCNSL